MINSVWMYYSCQTPSKTSAAWLSAMQVQRWFKDMRLSCMEKNMAILADIWEESPWLHTMYIADIHTHFVIYALGYIILGKSKMWHILQKRAYNTMHLSILMWHQQALNINNKFFTSQKYLSKSSIQIHLPRQTWWKSCSDYHL